MSGRHSDFFALMEAVGRPGCPICRLADEAGRRFLRSLLYERVSDVDTRDQLRRDGGLCREHTAMLLAIGDALGSSIIYADLLQAAVEGRVARGRCMVCRVAEDAAHRAIAALLAHIAEEDVLAAYIASDGLCLPHLSLVTGSRRAGAAVTALEGIERQRLEALAAECREFVRKSDYRRRGEPLGAERDAWRRAALKLAGGTPDNGP